MRMIPDPAAGPDSRRPPGGRVRASRGFLTLRTRGSVAHHPNRRLRADVCGRRRSDGGSGHELGAAFRVGAARVDITPPAATGSPAPAYEHERLYVRAIVIENDTTRAALISADQGNMPEEVWMAASKEIAAELKAPVQNIRTS